MLYAFQGVLDVFRGRVLTRIGASLDEALSGRIFDIVVRLPLKTRTSGDGLQAVRDLDQVRAFMSSLGPTALFDLPWMPLYLAICFIFHFWIGVTATIGALILVGVTLLTEFRTREPTKAAAETGATRTGLALASRRNAEVLQAMGMGGRVGALWGEANAKYMASQQRASDVAGGLGAVSKVLRMALQSAVLGVGAYLVIEQQATAGMIIASSILTSRALAPVELAIANWRGFVAARQSWKRLVELMAALPQRGEPLPLPAPRASMSVEGVSAVAARRAAPRRAGRRFRAQGRQWARRDRPERVRQILARPRARGRMGARSAAKSASTGPRSSNGIAEALGPPHRLPAAGRRALCRDRRREHRPLRSRARCRGGPRRCEGRERARPDPAPAGWL